MKRLKKIPYKSDMQFGKDRPDEHTATDLYIDSRYEITDNGIYFHNRQSTYMERLIARNMILRGIPVREIAEELGYTMQTIRDWTKDLR